MQKFANFHPLQTQYVGYHKYAIKNRRLNFHPKWRPTPTPSQKEGKESLPLTPPRRRGKAGEMGGARKLGNQKTKPARKLSLPDAYVNQKSCTRGESLTIS